MWFQITHLPQKGTCFRKLTNMTCLPIEPHHSTAFKTNLYTRLHNSGSNWAQIVHFSQEIVSGKIEYYFSVLVVFYIATTIKKSQRANHHTKLHNSGTNWAWPCPPKENLLENLMNIALVFHIPSCYIFSKQS